MTVPKLIGATMELEIKKLGKAACSLDVPKVVYPGPLYGVINSETITCDPTLARYRSEYNCG